MRDYGRTARIHALQVLLLYASLFNCGLLTSQHSWRHPIIWLNGGQGKHGQSFTGYGVVKRSWIVVWWQIRQHSYRVTIALVGSRRYWLEDWISMDNRKASVQDGVVAMTGLWQAASRQVGHGIMAQKRRDKRCYASFDAVRRWHHCVLAAFQWFCSTNRRNYCPFLMMQYVVIWRTWR